MRYYIGFLEVCTCPLSSSRPEVEFKFSCNGNRKNATVRCPDPDLRGRGSWIGSNQVWVPADVEVHHLCPPGRVHSVQAQRGTLFDEERRVLREPSHSRVESCVWRGGIFRRSVLKQSVTCLLDTPVYTTIFEFQPHQRPLRKFLRVGVRCDALWTSPYLHPGPWTRSAGMGVLLA